MRMGRWAVKLISPGVVCLEGVIGPVVVVELVGASE